MPTHALLGATGATGSAILRALLANPPPNFHLNILVRSKSKLFKAFPDLENTTSIKLAITEAQVSDTKAMTAVLRSAEVIHMVVATNESSPGCHIAQDAAAAVITALRTLSAEQGEKYIMPTVLVIRTASLSPAFQQQQGWLLHKFVWFALYHCYTDLDLACKQYAEVAVAEKGLLEYIYVDPPAIHDADGTAPTGYELIVDSSKGKQSDCLNYADLGVAFVEIAVRKNEFLRASVAVSATGKVKETWGTLAGYLAWGVKGRVVG
jgi:hypothetical protein